MIRAVVLSNPVNADWEGQPMRHYAMRRLIQALSLLALERFE